MLGKISGPILLKAWGEDKIIFLNFLVFDEFRKKMSLSIRPSSTPVFPNPLIFVTLPEKNVDWESRGQQWSVIDKTTQLVKLNFTRLINCLLCYLIVFECSLGIRFKFNPNFTLKGNQINPNLQKKKVVRILIHRFFLQKF